jgi:mono/diheme cytochrome c family protein
MSHARLEESDADFDGFPAAADVSRRSRRASWAISNDAAASKEGVMRGLWLAILMSGTLALPVHAQPLVPQAPMLQKTTVGSELYRYYCSNCHGADAKGRPASPAMRTPSADLTALAQKNNGVFPRDAVRSLLANGPTKGAAHGASDMPVWGTIFRAFDRNDTMVDVRIDNLVAYIESLQAASAGRSNSR